MTKLLPFAIVFAAASSVFAGAALFQDDFSAYRIGSDASPLWSIESGKWRVTPNGFEGADCEAGGFIAAGAAAGRKEWKDYTLSLRVKIVSRGGDWRDGPWIGVRCRGAAAGYTVGFYNRLTALHKLSAGRQTGDKTALAESPTTIKDKKWHTVRITAKGRRITVALDGKTILDAVDNDHNHSPAVAAGRIVLAARKYAKSKQSTRVLFDDVRVEAIGDAPASLKWTREAAMAEAPKQTSMLKFMRSRRGRRYSRVPRQVLAFYYTWYGRPERHGRWVHWKDVKPEEHDIATSTHYPAKGAYDSHDPAIIDWQIDLAKQAGLTGFIATWWGQGTLDDRAFKLLLDRAAAKGFKATVYWEAAPGKGQEQIDRAINDLLYLLRTYGSHPAFLKYDGKPVLFVYGRVMGKVPLGSWPAIINGTRAESPTDFLLIADGYKESFARLFDGVHTYNVCGWVKGKSPAELRPFAAKQFEKAVALARKHGRLSCITVIPGYNDTKIRTPGLDTKRHDGQTYRILWEEAMKADPDWVLITSWNEWHEGSEIEPSWEDGDKYIKLTKEYAPKFMAQPPSPGQPAEPADGLDAARARKLRNLYRGKTIGILPDYAGNVPFWLADAGLPLRELTWQDVLDANVLNAKRIPVLLYASSEKYVQSLKATNDVDRALLRYLRGGGLLVAMSFRPYPFYYNENGESVVAAGRFGLPLAGSGAQRRNDIPEGANVRGWEKPPAGARLSFSIDTSALPGLPKTAAFPAAGDQRWRPATPALVAKDDVYVPLARLVDASGKWYGDGIAYVEHKRTPPKGGKALYVWMRMPDALGKNAAYDALFKFAAAKVTGHGRPRP